LYQRRRRRPGSYLRAAKNAQNSTPLNSDEPLTRNQQLQQQPAAAAVGAIVWVSSSGKRIGAAAGRAATAASARRGFVRLWMSDDWARCVATDSLSLND